MSQRLFLFVQLEFPWSLDLPDGRYLIRSQTDEPEHVVVLGTLSAGRPSAARRPGGLRRGSFRRRRTVAPHPDPAPVTTARATVVDPVSLSAERQAKAWLADLDPRRDIPAAVTALNRVLYAQRIATADPYAREVSALQASTIRAGWGEGEQVAEGSWLHAVEVPPAALHGRRPAGGLPIRGRSAALRPHERLARLLASRERPLLCEELALRARLDLEQDRVAHAALELDSAYTAALTELSQERHGDLPLRVAELASLREGVSRAARAALPDRSSEPETSAGSAPAAPVAPGEAGEASEAEEAHEADKEAVDHALGRLEAVLRARSAAGFHGG